MYACRMRGEVCRVAAAGEWKLEKLTHRAFEKRLSASKIRKLQEAISALFFVANINPSDANAPQSIEEIQKQLDQQGEGDDSD